MQCKNVLTRIDALRTRELSPVEESAVENHLSYCRSCGASLGDVGELASIVRTLTVAPPRSCKSECSDSFAKVGEVWVAFCESGIRMISNESADALRTAYAKRYGRGLEEAPIPQPLRRQVEAALEGEGVDSPRVDLEELGDLEQDVLSMLTRIPRGQVRTYAWVARQVGRPRAVRAVANVIAKNVVPFVVPCHRVVPSSGGIGNYAFGSAMKRSLLEREGVDVEELERLGKKNIRFIGSRTTHIFCFPTCADARRIREENRAHFRDADDALEDGFRPCRKCQPVAA